MFSYDSQRTGSEKSFLNVELSMMGYGAAQDLQKNIVAARREKIINNDVVLWLEHSPVFTYGRHGGIDNLQMDPLLLEKRGIFVEQSERGGNITFHGPGQLVVYPIIDLEEARLDVPGYVRMLEEVMILTAEDFNVEIQRRQGSPGVWVGNRKIGSIGIAIQKGISFHGMALNVNLDLTPFEWIHPCGLTNITMSSLEKELSKEVELEKVRERAQAHMASIFEKDFVMISNEEVLKTEEHGLSSPLIGTVVHEKVDIELLNHRPVAHNRIMREWRNQTQSPKTRRKLQCRQTLIDGNITGR
ncbi:MAG: lipoyl(octanoyl) transferase LipB [Desulfobacteraceae bacterium]|nr:lipoyl(octanoyl) transferase LipB [Desulfobacteraceae bacterium]MBC2755827.1 lipoyl(octanoyl) transferase LipB [Desulfobacteraceae bacterium]